VDITKREGSRMDKREMIEGVLGRYLMPCLDPVAEAITGRRRHHLDMDALAESKDVIVIEAEVEHYYEEGNAWAEYQTQTYFPKINKNVWLPGHHGTPGPYLFFGVPKPKEKEDE